MHVTLRNRNAAVTGDLHDMTASTSSIPSRVSIV
jgi:hypothetical protein